MEIRDLNNLLQDKKSLSVTLVLSVLYVIPIMIADYDYLDDIGRNQFGYGWHHDGRFLSTLLGKIWSLNDAIVSIFPYSLIASALVLGFTGYILVSLLGIEKDRLVKWSSLFIITAPVYLGNLVFKFDCLPMSLSLLAVVFPYIFYDTRVKFFIVSTVGVFISLGLYQASATVYLIAGSIFLIQGLINHEWKKFFIKTLVISASFLLAFVLYTLALKILKLEVSRAEFIFGKSNMGSLLSYNNSLFFERIGIILRSGYYKYYVIAFCSISLLGLLYALFSAKDKLKYWYSFPMIIIIIAVNFWLISGVNIFLVNAGWDLRSFCGLGCFLVLCAAFNKHLKVAILEKLGRFSMAVLVFFSFILVAQFGKSLNYQTQFQNDFIAEIKPYVTEKPIKKIGMIGTLPVAPRSYYSRSIYPIFENLQSSHIGQFSYWAVPILNINGAFDNLEVLDTKDMVCNGELIKHSRFCNIRRVGDDTLILDFNKNECSVQDQGNAGPKQ